MKIEKLISPILILFVLGFSPALRAADMAGMEMGNSTAPATVELTLTKAEELALAGNPHIRAAQARAQEASKQASQDLSPSDPVFSIDRTFPGQEFWDLDENLGFPGKSFAKADVDGAETKRMQAMAEDTRRSILLKARQAYWEFYFRQKSYDLSQEDQGQWKVFAKALQSKELTGQWLSLSAIRTQMETAKAANGLITTSKALKVSQYNLNHLFNLPHATSYGLSQEPSPPSFDRKEEEEVRKALERNPMIEAARRAVEAQDARRNSAALDHLPDFNLLLSGLRDPAGNGFSDYGFMVGISLPVFFPLKQDKAMGQAGDELSAARYDLQGVQNETIHMVESAYVEADSAWRILHLYESGNLLRQTQRAWAAAQTAYRNEQMPLSEFLGNYNTYLETVTNYYQAKADYGKALAELDYEVGTSSQPDPVKGEK